VFTQNKRNMRTYESNGRASKWDGDRRQIFVIIGVIVRGNGKQLKMFRSFGEMGEELLKDGRDVFIDFQV
jgi:hypothetical protein